MILVEVTGQASAWPVYDQPDLARNPSGICCTSRCRRFGHGTGSSTTTSRSTSGRASAPWTTRARPAGSGGSRPVREFTNLGWPETPFGAEQRPFGQHIDMLAACTFEWTDQPGASETVPVAVSSVYLRVRRARHYPAGQRRHVVHRVPHGGHRRPCRRARPAHPGRPGVDPRPAGTRRSWPVTGCSPT